MLGQQGDVHAQDNPFLVSDPSPHSLLRSITFSSDQAVGTVENDAVQQAPAQEEMQSEPHDTQGLTSTNHADDVPLWPADSAILVAVRVRPFNEKERARLAQAPSGRFNLSTDGSLSANYHTYVEPAFLSSSGKHGSKNPTIRKVVNALDERVLVFDPPDAESISKYKRGILPVQAYRKFKDMRYAFDRVFHEDAQQEEVFRNTTRHLIDGVLGGFNGTLFAYGATGCGKTHTISGTPEKPGIIYLTMQELYERIRSLEDEKTFEVSVSYLEVYNETLRDLLAEPHVEGTKPSPLHMREDANKRISISGLSEHHPQGMDEVMELISRGNNNRTMSPTEANATSSRSHAVLQINICQRLKTANVNEDFTMATLSLIDLAGSERASATRNRGERMLEGANINKSLLALGNCINALCDHRRGKAHIPYRDSKLTRLLKFSLGGNCKTVMIACVSPSSQHYEETHNTLKYANRAKNITTKVTKNTLNVDRHVSEYVQAIYELRQEVSDLKTKLQRQTGQESHEKARLQQEAYRREFEDTVHKVRATFQTARDQEMGYAQLQAKLFVLTERLSTLYHWRSGFDEARRKAAERRDEIEQGLAKQDDRNSQSFAGSMQNLNSSISKASSYISVVDDLIDRLNTHILELSSKMQDQEDALKMYAVGIQTMERQANITKMGFPFERLYELEKKSQALESHNKILTTKLELSDQALSEQFGSLKDFMELNARSLVGLRPEIDLAEEQGKPATALNDVYMSAISSFTDLTRRIQSLLPAPLVTPQPPLGSGPSPASASNSTNPYASPLKKTIGLKGSRIMSILPDVPQTPVKKRYTTTNILPHVSMDTVDTNVALGTSSLFGGQSPIRLYPGGDGGDAPPINSPSHNRIATTPRKKSSPMPGVIFSPVRKRVRGGLRQPRLAPTPTKRNVNFSLDVVEEDEERLTTGVRDPSTNMAPPPAQPFSQLLREAANNGISSPSTAMDQDMPAVTCASHARAAIPSTPRFNAGLSGGARRVAMVSTTEPGGGAAKRVVHAGKSELSKGAQRVVAASSSRSAGSSPSPFANNAASPVKRARQMSNAAPGQDSERGSGKRMKPSSPPLHLTSSAHRGINSGRSTGAGSPDQQQQQRRAPMTTNQGKWTLTGHASPSAADVEMRDKPDSLHDPSSSPAASPSSKPPALNSLTNDLSSGLSPPTSRLANMTFSIRVPTKPLPTANAANGATAVASESPTVVSPNAGTTATTGRPVMASFAAATLSSASRRRSLGGSLLMRGPLGAAGRSGSSSGTPSRAGEGGGGGPIRDLHLRRKLRATSNVTPPTPGSSTGARVKAAAPNITPPKEIPSYQQILQRRTGVTGSTSRRLSFRPGGGGGGGARLSPLRGGAVGRGGSTGEGATATGHIKAGTSTESSNAMSRTADDTPHAIESTTTPPQQPLAAPGVSFGASVSSRRKSGLPVPVKQSTPTGSSSGSSSSSSTTAPSMVHSAALGLRSADSSSSLLLSSTSSGGGGGDDGGSAEDKPSTASTLAAMMSDESAWEDQEEEKAEEKEEEKKDATRRRKSLPAHRVSTRLTLEEIESVYDIAKERANRRRSMLPT